MGALNPWDEYRESGLIDHWARIATERLAQAQPQIDAVNVFPVADHDTGRNMLATMRAGLDALYRFPDIPWTAANIAQTLLQGVLDGARGNSGIILSQFWRAVSQTIARRRFDADGYAEALALSVALIGESVADPVEGTAWSVLRAAADRARELAAEGRAELAAVAAAVVEAAALAVARTPEQLPTLAEAKVVDAGGLGVLCVLDALAETVEEEKRAREAHEAWEEAETAPEPEQVRPEVLALLESIGPAEPVSVKRAGSGPARKREPAPAYHEVELELLGATAEDAARLRSRLADVGDSVVVAGDGTRLKAHAHTFDAGAVVLAGIQAGRVVAVRITNLPVSAPEPTRAVLALAAGEGLAALFRDAGAHVLDVGPGASPEGLAEAVAGIEADEVFVLPNGALAGPDLIRAASEIRAAGREARFLPCGSPLQGLAAIAVHDPDQPAGDDEYTMASAAAGARWARLVTAEEEAFTWAGKCSAGDCLGLVGDEVVLVSEKSAHACADLVDLMLASGGELVTVLLGQLGDESVADDMAEHMRRRHPGIELVVLDGGQPGEIAQVGVE
ncbi:DAK2 domain-containing protein [Segniliparus rugosus]|uniref:DAK2 domain fusion protein YloV n=1 Tax=Segniliparus rugosus (strain ATCC BAA-974 / DSM 45345 / CCUG 50838 / CIP 108380 / JCM 13579 / CDC 945) TaxID=679197 RepID=E5XMH2_SEGRC|nr:DAK2 domain-containing protein [Segniliparus rugosus]EFV14437.2 DAK2 domain fusion protein YloV [Segniliparus rugosus ATCC BAA-974]